MGFGSHATFVVTKLPTLGPNTRRNLAAFPIASRVRRKRQRLRSNRLIESAAARFHISRYSSAAALPISPSVSRPRSRWQPSLASVGSRLAASRELLRENFRMADHALRIREQLKQSRLLVLAYEGRENVPDLLGR